jgi:hypothetical protein
LIEEVDCPVNVTLTSHMTHTVSRDGVDDMMMMMIMIIILRAIIIIIIIIRTLHTYFGKC